MSKLNADNAIMEVDKLGLQYFFTVIKKDNCTFYDLYVFPETEGGILITLEIKDGKRKFVSLGRVTSNQYEILDEVMYKAIFPSGGEKVLEIHNYLDTRVEEN